MRSRLKILLCLIFANCISARVHCAEAATATVRNKYVRSAPELHAHFALHARRVQKLGLVLREHFSADFPHVNPAQVESFLAVHDRAKLDNTPAFRKKFWKHPDGPAFVERLMAFYNRPRTATTKETRDDGLLRQTIEELNSTDRTVTLKFFEEHGMLENHQPNKTAQELLRIERLADVVDRNSDPVALEEFGLDEQLPLSNFITNDDDLTKARWLKVYYAQTVRGLAYSQYANASFQSCEGLTFVLISAY